MIQKKICMLGAYSVGKTSLVQRYVTSGFSEKYLTTVGVKVDKKPVTVDGREVNLILWDMAGEDELQKVRTSYLRGAAGYLLVLDGTRVETADVGLDLIARVRSEFGDLPALVLANKADLTDEWAFGDEQRGRFIAGGHEILETSAKTGARVEDAFATLARRILPA